MSAQLRVLKPGMLTTVQDAGRPGLGRYGISPSGAMDPFAARAANLLVGNAANAPLLEVTGPGAVFEVRGTEHAVRVALTGADLGAPIAPWSAAIVGMGTLLRFSQRRTGARAYLAFEGGIEAPRSFGSTATDLTAGLGRPPLRSGEELSIGGSEPAQMRTDDVTSMRGSAKRPPHPREDEVIEAMPGGRGGISCPTLTRWYTDPFRLRVVAVAHARIDPALRSAFLSSDLLVTPQSNRAGYRLLGPFPEASARGLELSEGLAPGMIQLPPGGQAILLMADRPTVGGYPCIASVIRADLPKAAQLWPGDRVRFVEVTLTEAHELARAQEQELRQLEHGTTETRPPSGACRSR